MKVFWDTSAVINALVSETVRARRDQDEHGSRPHMLHEFFAIMTGRGILVEDESGLPARLVLTGNDAARWLADFAPGLQWLDLTPATTLAELAKAQARNVAGGHVYDYGHALAADVWGADFVLTRNEDDFRGLTQARLEWP